MATYNLGRILPIFRGAWSPSKSYDKLDVVTFEGSSYMAISDNTNKRPDENPSAWILSAAKGDPGEPGKDGPTYKPGVGISIVNDVISVTGGGEGGGFYFGGFGVEIDENTNSINAEVRAENDMPTQWQLVTMTGLPLDVAEDFECKNVFHYKGKTYYSAGLNKNYVLDVLSWEKVEWVGVEIYGEDIFVDAKGDMYYFHGNQYMKYDEDLETWPTVSINITNAYGRYMFVGKNGYSYYSENRNKTYKIKAGNITTWEKVTVNQDCPATFIWEDETSTYYSNGATHFFYDYENDRWRTQRWAGVNALYGNQIWKQGSHIFFSADSGATYVKKGSKWEFVYTLSVLSGEYVFADGENVFFFVDNRAMQLVIPDPFYVTRHGDKLATEEFVLEHAGKINEGFGITVTKTDDGTEVSTVVSSKKGPSVSNWEQIEEIKVDDQTMTYDDLNNVWNDNDGNTFLYTSKGWYKWDAATSSFKTIEKTHSDITLGKYIWSCGGRIFYTYGRTNYEWVNGAWTDISIAYKGNGTFNGFAGCFIAVGKSKIMAIDTVSGSYRSYGVFNLEKLEWTFNYFEDHSPSDKREPWVDSNGVFHFGNVKFVGDSMVSDGFMLLPIGGSINVWTNVDGKIFYGLSNEITDGIHNNPAEWLGEDITASYKPMNIGGRHIIIVGGKFYELREDKVVDKKNRVLINEDDLAIKLKEITAYYDDMLSGIDNLLKTV